MVEGLLFNSFFLTAFTAPFEAGKDVSVSNPITVIPKRLVSSFSRCQAPTPGPHMLKADAFPLRPSSSPEPRWILGAWSVQSRYRGGCEPELTGSSTETQSWGYLKTLLTNTLGLLQA